MRQTKLILIDGLPGSGKSTTAERIAGRLRAQGFEADLLPECRKGHPLNVGGELHPSGNTMGQEFFARYTPESLIAESLQRWHHFALEKDRAGTVTIAESYPFQNSLRLLFQMDAPLGLIQEYEAEVEAAISCLNPVLIYFDHAGAAQSLPAIYAQRGPEWTAYFVAVATQCAYARARNLHGFDGTLTLMEEYRNLMNAMRARLPYPVQVLQDCHHHWQTCHAEIETFLELPQSADGGYEQ